MGTAAIANQIFWELGNHQTTAGPYKFVAVPGGATARWLLPARDPEIGNLLDGWTPYRLWPRAAWTAIKTAIQFGRIADIPGISFVEVEEPARVPWTELGWCWTDDPIPVIYLGTPGPRRKAVVHLVERRSGRCRAVVKVPLTNEARGAVLHEAEMLEALQRARCEFSPQLLYVDPARAITTQTFVEGRPVKRQFGPECWQLLHSMLLPGETTSLEIHAKPWAREMEDRSRSLHAAEAIRRLCLDSALPECWEHGDFMPWNLKRRPDGKYVLLDWEDGKPNGLPLMDAYHFLHMQDFLFGGRPQLHADDLLQGALGMSIPPKLVRALELAYLARTYLACTKTRCETRATFVDQALIMRLRKTN